MKMPPKLDSSDGIYLALGGGAARGFAHLGVLAALEKANIPIAGICGTSIGAMVGACYALSGDAEAVIRDFLGYIKGPEFNKSGYAFMRREDENLDGKVSFKERLRQGFLLGKSFATGGVITFEEFQAEVHALLPDKTFADTKFPFFATAVDLSETCEVVIDHGFLRSAVLVSSAIPGAFPAIQGGDSVYVDGGWMNRVPVNPLKSFGARRVLAIDVSDADLPEAVNPKRGIAVLQLANKAARKRLNELQMEEADLVWRLPVTEINWADFLKIERTIEIGMQFAEDHMHELYPLLEPPRPVPWWRKLARRLADNEPPPRKLSFELRTLWDVSPALQINIRDETL